MAIYTLPYGAEYNTGKDWDKHPDYQEVSDFITEIFRGVVGGLGDIFGGGGTTSRTPDINPSLFGGTSRSPFSSSRSQFNFGGFG